MKRLLTIVSVFLLHTSLQAGGPVTSRYGIGDLIWFGSSRAMAMGGLGYGLRGEGFINIINPAGLSGIGFTRFDGSFDYTSYTSVSNGLSGGYWRAGLQNVALAIPIDTSHGIVMSLESAPFSNVGYNAERTVSQSGVVTKQSLHGTGGLSAISLGGSVNITSDISLGAKVSYLYGRLQQFVVVDFENDRFTDDQQDRSTYYTSPLFTFGAIAHVGRTSFLPGELRIGATISLPTSPATELVTAFKALDTVIVSKGSGDIPMRIGIGASLVMKERYTAIVDVAYQDWSSIAAPAPATLKSALRISGGFEIMPDRNELDFFGRIGYRIGFGYEQTYVSIAGTNINDMFGSLGTSVPMGPGRLSIAVKAGIRGTNSGVLQKDTYITLNLGVTSSEVWFMEFAED